MNDALFAELLESVREGGAILRGERKPSRTLFVADQYPVGDDPELAPTPYPFKWTRRVVILLACLFLSVLAGGITSIVITNVDSAGYFVRWQRLSDPPAAVTSLAIGLSGFDEAVETLYAHLASGDIAAITPPDAVWQTGVLPPDDAAVPCPLSLPALAHTTHPPDGLTGCVFHHGSGTDCDHQLAFALDGDGRVWQWSNGRCALATLGVAFFSFLASGLVYLLLFSLLAVTWLGRRERAGR